MSPTDFTIDIEDVIDKKSNNPFYPGGQAKYILKVDVIVISRRANRDVNWLGSDVYIDAPFVRRSSATSSKYSAQAYLYSLLFCGSIFGISVSAKKHS